MAESNPYPPQAGIWKLIAPDGRIWEADHPWKCLALEQKQRIPPQVMIERLKASLRENIH